MGYLSLKVRKKPTRSGCWYIIIITIITVVVGELYYYYYIVFASHRAFGHDVI